MSGPLLGIQIPVKVPAITLPSVKQSSMSAREFIKLNREELLRAEELVQSVEEEDKSDESV